MKPGRRNTMMCTRSLWILLLLFCVTESFSQRKTRIDILYSDALIFDKKLGTNVKRLVGNVQLQHDDVVMTCDSAYMYEGDRMVDAFSQIHVRQGDSLHLYGEQLRYRSDTRLAQVRKNVRLIDKETTVETQFLDFDINRNIGYYFNGGVIYNGRNTLSSQRGYYYSKPEIFHYRDSVKIVNPDYTIRCDSLDFDSGTETAFFRSPTEITGKDMLVNCLDGWYNLETENAHFIGDAKVVNGPRIIRGDSIYYNRVTGYGRIISQAEIHDTAEMVILRGNFAEYFENPESTFVTDSALFIQYSDGDSLFLHADTLRSITDTVGDFRILKAFYGVKIFREDLQGACDSLVYSFADSVIYLYHDPVLWTEENQMTSDSMRIFTRNRKIDRLEMYRSAFIVSQEDVLRFNQIKGKDMTGLFSDGKLYRINVNGNGQTIYYARDGESIAGVNKAESSNIVIFIRDNKIDRIRLINTPDGILNPPNEIPDQDMRLEDFRWLSNRRPGSKNEIFLRK